MRRSTRPRSTARPMMLVPSGPGNMPGKMVTISMRMHAPSGGDGRLRQHLPHALDRFVLCRHPLLEGGIDLPLVERQFICAARGGDEQHAAELRLEGAQ